MTPLDPPRRRLRFPIPISILLFLALTAVGAYYVRKGMLERAMRSSMEIADTDAMLRLARTWPAPVRVRDDQRRTPLHLAAWVDDNALVLALLDAGADPAARDVRGDTALHFARSVSVATALVAHGADVRVNDEEGWTPLYYAASTAWARDRGWYDKAALSSHIKLVAGRPRGCPGLIEFLVSKGADVNRPDRWRRTLLYAAKSARHWSELELAFRRDPGCLAAWDRMIATLEKLGAGE